MRRVTPKGATRGGGVPHDGRVPTNCRPLPLISGARGGAELAAANANLRRLREETIAEWTEELAAETNPYHREFLQRQIEEVRKIGAGILDD